MAEVIDITVSAKVKNGPSVSFFSSMNVDAYDKLDVDVLKTKTKTIQLVPSVADSVTLLLIKSDHYSELITYRVNGAGPVIKLDTPQSFIGLGSLDALDDTNVPESIEVTNNSTSDLNIEILVGRKAI